MPVDFIGLIRTKSASELNSASGTLGDDIIDPAYVREFAKAHEQGGFDKVLIGYSSSSPDDLTVASFAASATERLGFLIAYRPGFVAPTLADRKAATLDHFTNGRIAYISLLVAALLTSKKMVTG
ncbi:LLM class flavin-dependent oxidoreductase [Nostoc sp.]|uniref:LLM class flavin-dependent oxidoreductase n=1 Tax=Nostoc sp. TaxID=1180 RepID=UPI003FA5366A